MIRVLKLIPYLFFFLNLTIFTNFSLFQSPSPVNRSTSVDTLSVDTLEDDGDEVDGNVVIYVHVKCRILEQGIITVIH